MLKIVYSLILILMILGGALVWRYNTYLKEAFHWMHHNDRIKAFEIQHSPSDIIDANKGQVVHDNKSLEDPTLMFYPYLAMKVSFLGSEGKKEKGVLLWSLSDGEAVINADTWEMTNGFSKAIDNKASEDDFNLLQTISRHGGSITKEILERRLHLEGDRLDKLIDKAISHHLIVNIDGHYRLANEHSKIDIDPQTHITEPLGTKVYVHVVKEKPKYSQEKIQDIARAAFGHSFSIDETEEIYLPVYAIEVRNPKDHSKLKTYWNGVNGKKFILPKEKQDY